MASTDHAAEVQQPADDVVPVVSIKHVVPAGLYGCLACCFISSRGGLQEPRSIKALTLQHLKRTFDMFAGNWGERPQMNEAA